MDASPPRRSVALLVAVVALALTATVAMAFVLTPQGQRLDAAAYGGAGWAQVGPWELVDRARALLVLPAAGATAVVALAWLAARRQWRRGAMAAVVLLGSTISIQVLKHEVLVRPDFGFPPTANSLPSGHTGVTTAAWAVLLVAATARWRPAIALVGSWLTALTGMCAVVAFQHRPSDIVAAILVVLAWVSGASALLERRARAEPGRGPSGAPALRGAVATSAETGAGAGIAAVLLVQGVAFALPAAASVMLAALQPDRPVGGLETFVALLGGLAAIAATSSIAFAAMWALLRGPGEPANLRTPRGSSRARGSAS